MATQVSRSEKVKRIFQQFDANRDGGLDREEMAALFVAVNPRVDSIDLDDIFRTYGEYIDCEKGLSFDGLLRTYDDGAGDVDRDFDALGLELKPVEGKKGISQASEGTASSSSVADERVMAWAASPNHGIVFDRLESFITNLKTKQMKGGRMKSDNSDVLSEPGWSKELGPSSEFSDWDESGPDYASIVKESGDLRSRADRARSNAEAFDGHMAIGGVLYGHGLFKEALLSFNRACELFSSNWKPHFRAGICLCVLKRYSEAKEEFRLALKEAEGGENRQDDLLGRIHVNLGIALEGEGMILSACEHYRKAAGLCDAHFRAKKLLGSALLGVGEYKAAVKALKEAIDMNDEYADAHCDLASALHAMGDYENAEGEFQKAININRDHLDALNNLGGLYMDMRRFREASEMYTQVLGVCPNHWRAQLNKAVSLLGAGEKEEANTAMKEALKMTNRVELHDAVSHLKQLQKRKLRGKGNGSNGESAFITVEPSKFKTVGEKTTLRPELAIALDIRAFQRITRLNRCKVEKIKKEMREGDVTMSNSGPEKSVQKASVEVILRGLLSFLKPETFVGAVKAINQKILSVLDEAESGIIDLGMFFAIIAPLCWGTAKERKQIAYESLVWRSIKKESDRIKKSDALRYIELLRAIYIPTHGISEMPEEIHGETDRSLCSVNEFMVMFDDQECGFSIMPTLLKLESGDGRRWGSHACATCLYPIIGSRFKEVKLKFSLCAECYSEGKVPCSSKQEEYRFKEYAKEGGEAVKEKCMWFGSKVGGPRLTLSF